MAVDIDAAFETLILRERAAVAAVTGQLAALRPALRALSSTACFSAFGTALAARQEFLVQTQEWVQYAVDTSVLTALADRVGLVFDALETYLPTIGEGVRTAHNLAATDAAFQASLSAAGLSLDDFVAALMLPTSDIAAGYLSFLYDATQFAPDNALVLAAYNQVQVRALPAAARPPAHAGVRAACRLAPPARPLTRARVWPHHRCAPACDAAGHGDHGRVHDAAAGDRARRALARPARLEARARGCVPQPRARGRAAGGHGRVRAGWRHWERRRLRASLAPPSVG